MSWSVILCSLKHLFIYIFLSTMLSVTESEIRQGILQVPDANTHCLWFKREIPGIEEQESTKILSRYFGLYLTLVKYSKVYEHIRHQTSKTKVFSTFSSTSLPEIVILELDNIF